MLLTIAIILVVLWALGLVTETTIGGVVHILLVLAVTTVLFQLMAGSRVGYGRPNTKGRVKRPDSALVWKDTGDTVNAYDECNTQIIVNFMECLPPES